MDGVLQARGIVLASKCQCCNSQETISHVILYNEEIMKVWRWFSGIFQVRVSSHLSVQDRFKSWVYSSDQIGKSHIRIFIPILIGWFAWTARNASKHEGKKISATCIIFKIMNYIYVSQAAKSFSRDFWQGDFSVAASWNVGIPIVPRKPIKVVKWTKPPPNWYKVNTDGAHHHPSHRAAIGGVIRDAEGRILHAFQDFIGRVSIIMAELTGIWKGLKMSKDLGYNNVMIETDSKVALLLLSKDNPHWHWKLVPLILKILRLCNGRNIKLRHVYREGNQAADWFASTALNTRVSSTFGPGEIPMQVRKIAYGDKHGWPYIRTH